MINSVRVSERAKEITNESKNLLEIHKQKRNKQNVRKKSKKRRMSKESKSKPEYIYGASVTENIRTERNSNKKAIETEYTQEHLTSPKFFLSSNEKNSVYGIGKSATMDTFRQNRPFSMTTPDNFYPSDRQDISHIKFRDTKIDFIDKNKKLGRVSDINRRRFSGAFDHLNLFPSSDRNQERLLRIKSQKSRREIVTARTAVRVKINEFKEVRNRSKTPAVGESYRNFSINEKQGNTSRNRNALITKIDPHELYSKIVNNKDSCTSTKFELKDKVSENIEKLDVKSENHDENKLGIHSNQMQGIQYFTLFNKTLRKPNPVNFEKLKKHVKTTPKDKHLQKMPQKIKSYRRENIQLDTVLGKLLDSYAKTRPRALIDPSKPCEKGKRPQIPLMSMERSKSSNLLLFSKESKEDELFNFKSNKNKLHN